MGFNTCVNHGAVSDQQMFSLIFFNNHSNDGSDYEEDDRKLLQTLQPAFSVEKHDAVYSFAAGGCIWWF